LPHDRRPQPTRHLHAYGSNRRRQDARFDALCSQPRALRHNQRAPRKQGIEWQSIRRIIVAIPYLNIIQQTTLELKKVFGDVRWDEPNKAWIASENPAVVLEHHSQAQDPPLDEKKVDQGKASDYSYERTLR
jgi:hypothetical protein